MRGESPSLNYSITYSSVKNNMKDLIRLALIFLAAIYLGKAVYCSLRLLGEVWKERRSCQ